MIKTDDLTTTVVFLPIYFKLDTGHHVDNDAKCTSNCELKLINVLKYIGKKYYKMNNYKTKCSSLKCGITYIHEKCAISKTAIKMWCKTIFSNFKHREFVYIHKMSDKIFNILYELARSDRHLENMIYGSTHEASYYHIAPTHARNIDYYANHIYYAQYSNLAKLKEELDRM